MAAKSVGSPIAWLGRTTMYLSGVYLFIAVTSAARDLRLKGESLETGVANFFRHHLQSLVEERTRELSLAKEELQIAHNQLERANSELETRVEKRTAELRLSNEKLMLEIENRKRAEEALKQTLSELTRSNEDLQQFAYVASHDLQEPLRNVASCIQLLRREYGDRFEGNADDYMNYAIEGAVRMKALIQDLLTYSRITTRGKTPGSVDCEETFNGAIKNLASAIQETGAVITHDPLPTIWADDTQLLQVFQNLIANGIKFHRDTSPRIHVSATKDSNKWIFSVKDNGIGIQEKYLNRIFIIFQRLNKRSKYAGTGMGLAIVKKVVERHGGQVWVESEPGTGSAFYFSIPQKELV